MGYLPIRNKITNRTVAYYNKKSKRLFFNKFSDNAAIMEKIKKILLLRNMKIVEYEKQWNFNSYVRLTPDYSLMDFIKDMKNVEARPDRMNRDTPW